MTCSILPEEVAVTIRKRNRRTFWIVLALLVVVWFVIRPGIFTIQPIGALPDGITFVYYSRGYQMPVFSSLDGLCLKTQGAVTLLCRVAALGAVGDLTDRVLFRLPYNHWAYLLSTGGSEFEK